MSPDDAYETHGRIFIGYRGQLSGNDVTHDVPSALLQFFSMAPLLVPLKCGFHIQRRKLSLLLQQSSTVHSWSCHDHRVANKRKQRSTYQVHSPLSHTLGHDTVTQGQILKLYKHTNATLHNLVSHTVTILTIHILLCCLHVVFY